MSSINNGFIGFFDDIVQEFDELSSLISAVEIMSDVKLYNHYLKRHKQLAVIAEPVKKYYLLEQDIVDYNTMLNQETDIQQRNLILEQIEEAENQKLLLLAKAKESFAQNKLLEKQNVSIEITTKTDNEFVGFVKDLFIKFLEDRHAIFEVEKDEADSVFVKAIGKGVFEILNLFSGKLKKIQFGSESIVTVVVIKNIESNNEVKEEDLQIQTTRSSGAGGQHINKTDSAVRVTHVPTGIVVECQEERSQTQNKEKAIEKLKEKIAQINLKNSQKNEENQRNALKTKLFGNTPSVIFNFDENKVYETAHKLEYKLKEIIDGKIEIIFNDINE